MRLFYSMLFLFLSHLTSAQNISDLPPNPKLGNCYVKCIIDKNEFGKWKSVDCDLINFQSIQLNFNANEGSLSELDKKQILKRFKKIIKKNYTVEISSHYDSKYVATTNAQLSKERGILVCNYLVEQGVNPKNIRLSSYGNTKPLEICEKNIDCKTIYNKNTRIEFRVINVNEEYIER